MSYVALVVTAVCLTICLSRGSWNQVKSAEFRSAYLIAISFALQIVAGALGTSFGRGNEPALALLLASYALLFAFCVANRRWLGIWVILLGLSANAFSIALNGGMPTRTPSHHSAIAESIKHRRSTSSDHVAWLTNVIWVPKPFSTMISIGDVLIGLGSCGVAYSVSRRTGADALVRASND